MPESHPLYEARQALAIDSRELAAPHNLGRLMRAREELQGAISMIATHYSLSDAESTMLLAQLIQEHAARVGCADIASSSHDAMSA